VRLAIRTLQFADLVTARFAERPLQATFLPVGVTDACQVPTGTVAFIQTEAAVGDLIDGVAVMIRPRRALTAESPEQTSAAETDQKY